MNTISLKKNTILTHLTVTRLNKSGTAIFVIEGHDRKIHVSGGLLPGMVCDIRIIRKNRKAIIGRVITIHDMGPMADMKHIRCDHYIYPEDESQPHRKGCGGCKRQAVKYEDQLQLKQSVVKKCLGFYTKEIGILPVLPSPEARGYRNKVEFTFGKYITGLKEQKKVLSDWSLGFHKQGQFGKIIDVDHCDLIDETVNEIYQHCKKALCPYPVYDQVAQDGALRYLMIRQAKRTNQIMLVLSVHTGFLEEGQLEELKKLLMEDTWLTDRVTTAMLIVHNGLGGVIADAESEWHTLWGEGTIQEQLCIDDHTFSFDLSPKSFFQTNTKGCELLYGVIASVIEQTPGPLSTSEDILLDLYCGTGTIGIIIAGLMQSFSTVIGVDEVVGAIQDARINALKNTPSIDTHFFAGRTEKVMSYGDGKVHFHEGETVHEIDPQKINTVIVDPPRSGLHDTAIQTLKDLKQNCPDLRLCYISCNPDSLARDLQKLQDSFTLHVVQPVDMFPHTHHIETVVGLS